MLGGRALARTARQRELISDETLAAIEGLSVLRDLTAHGNGDIGVDRAREYLALASGLLMSVIGSAIRQTRYLVAAGR